MKRLDLVHVNPSDPLVMLFLFVIFHIEWAKFWQRTGDGSKPTAFFEDSIGGVFGFLRRRTLNVPELGR